LLNYLQIGIKEILKLKQKKRLRLEAMEKLKKEREEEREKLIEEAETEVDKEQHLKREGAKPLALTTLCLRTYFGSGTISSRDIFDQTAFLRYHRCLQLRN
jgi:hypothetical protein